MVGLAESIETNLFVKLNANIRDQFTALRNELINGQAREKETVGPHRRLKGAVDSESEDGPVADGELTEDTEMSSIDQIPKETISFLKVCFLKFIFKLYELQYIAFFVQAVIDRPLQKPVKEEIMMAFPQLELDFNRAPKVDEPIFRMLQQKGISIKQIPIFTVVEAIQIKMLEAVNPLITLHAETLNAEDGNYELDPSAVKECVQASLALLGNANAAANFERQKSILGSIQKDLAGYASKEGGSSKDLFGAETIGRIRQAIELKKEFDEFAKAMGPPAKRGRSSYSFFSRGRTRGSRRGFRSMSYRGRGSFRGNSKPTDRKGENFCLISEYNVPVGGRVSLCCTEWQQYSKDPWILDTITGYKLPFHSIPPMVLHAHNTIDKEMSSLVAVEINALLLKNAIEKASSKYFVNPIFLVPKKDNGWRPVLNLKKLNSYIEAPHFKMEQIGLLKDILKKGMWMAKLDLKDAYLSIPIQQCDRKYLQFEYENCLYQFKVLPFGLSSAPFVFTKLMKPFLSYLRAEGHVIIMFLDDMLILGSSQSEVKNKVNLICSRIKSLGFIINIEKSILDPVQVIEFLGHEIDSFNLTIAIPMNKRVQIKNLCEDLLKLQQISTRELARIVGKIAACNLNLTVEKTNLRHCQMEIMTRWNKLKDWDVQQPLLEESRMELIWWKDNILTVKSKPIQQQEAEIIIESDASLQGWGARYRNQCTGGSWTKEDKQLYPHINSLELMACFLGIKSFLKNQTNVSVLLKMDNKTAVAYVNRFGGTKSTILNNLAKKIWDWCSLKEIWIKAEYLPGKQNLWADWESRNSYDSSDWKLDKSVTEALFRFHHPCNVDLFASRTNHQLQNYYSWKPDPYALAIDAFSKDWKNIKGYAFPPFCMVGKCVSQCITQEATILLIAPVWPNQVWYPLLLQSSISEPILLPQWSNLLTNPMGHQHPMIGEKKLWLAAWRISGDVNLQMNFQKKLKSCYSLVDDWAQGKCTTARSDPLIAGALNGDQIQFQHLFPML